MRLLNIIKKLHPKYPIKSIEEFFAEEDWEIWKKITNEMEM